MNIEWIVGRRVLVRVQEYLANEFREKVKDDNDEVIRRNEAGIVNHLCI